MITMTVLKAQNKTAGYYSIKNVGGYRKMKRIMAVILSLILLIVLNSSIAYDDEITFQGIPWESSPEEVEKILKEKYGKDFKGMSQLTEPYETTISFPDESGSSVERIVNLAMYYAPLSVKIAGYETDGIGMYFLCPFGDTNANNGKLIIAGPALKSENETEAEKDLTAKLNQVYGEQAEVGNPIWNGANNTHIMITHMNGVVLTYYKDIDTETHSDLIKNPEPVAATPVPSNNVDPSDTDGL